MEFTSQKRNAAVGETVLYYESGDKSGIAVPAVVTAVSDMGAMLAVHQPRRSRHQVVEWSRHVNDPYWEGRDGLRQRTGAWDFHPIYGPLFTKGLHLEKIRLDRLEELSQQKAEAQSLTSDEYEALKALEIHGPVISRIAEDTGLSVARLDKLPQFSEAFKAAKLDKWREKNATPPAGTSVDTEVDEGEAPGDDAGFYRSGKDAMTALGMTQEEWDDLKSRNGFPRHWPGKGWATTEVREWMSVNMSGASV